MIYHARLNGNLDTTASEIIDQLKDAVQGNNTVDFVMYGDNVFPKAECYFSEEDNSPHGRVSIENYTGADINYAFCKFEGTENQCLRNKSKLLNIVKGLSLI